MSKSIYEICIELERAGLEKPKPKFGQKWIGRNGDATVVFLEKDGIVYHDFGHLLVRTKHSLTDDFVNSHTWQPTEGDLIRAIQGVSMVSKVELIAKSVIFRLVDRSFCHFFEADTLFENLANAYIWAKENLK